MNTYEALTNQIFEYEEYSLIPIRSEDRFDIMEWRNEQQYHLRQSQPLTAEDQELYFERVVKNLFQQPKPEQILFSFMQSGQCIGYGGLVHINWANKNAEVSFIMKTELEKFRFEELWKVYLKMIKQVGFDDLKLHKIFTYAYDLRPRLNTALDASNFKRAARLKDHVLIDGKYVDVLIHECLNSKILLRSAEESDLEITFEWASDKEVRRFSHNTDAISLSDHSAWFVKKLGDSNCLYFIALNSNVEVGSFRLDIESEGNAIISYLLSSNFHGRGLGLSLLKSGIEAAKSDGRIQQLTGEVLIENKASIKLFEKLNFTLVREENNVREYNLSLK